MIYCLPIPVFHLLLTTSSDSILISGVLSRMPCWFVFLRRLSTTLSFSLWSRKSSWPSLRFFMLNWDPPTCLFILLGIIKFRSPTLLSWIL